MTWIGVISALVTVGVYLQPKLSAVPSDPLRSRDAFSVPFIIANEGYLPLHDVQVQCVLGMLDVRPDSVPGELLKRSTSPRHEMVATPKVPPFSLARSESTVFSCPVQVVIPMDIRGADMDVVIRFRSWLLPWRSEESFRFRLAKGDDGTPHWLPAPKM